MLIAMQVRLAGDPYAALGVSPAATPAEIRAAFLALTKTYHPVRFGYMSAELQRLSNEVFLSLRGAHDAIARPARAAASARADRSGAFQKSDRSGVFPRTERSSDVFPAVTAPRSDRSSGVLPAVTAPRSDRSSGVLPAQPPPTARPVAGRPTNAPPVGAARPEDRELAGALEQLQRGQWAAARATLSALAARTPNVPRYLALLSYARGREAQLAHRLDEARVELQAALQLDPDLQLAKTALAELFTRRK
jgi:hypothetical protein